MCSFHRCACIPSSYRPSFAVALCFQLSVAFFLHDILYATQPFQATDAMCAAIAIAAHSAVQPGKAPIVEVADSDDMWWSMTQEMAISIFGASLQGHNARLTGTRQSKKFHQAATRL